ncbi:uncharacterized protein LOC127239623 [Andrographis paniculata]|uniref:uncharacterized protein LOC127239623 n=1 Tax=Andrographis paniculata TaxID=175694 RepID=UPI0021E81756|nr:uncharacterized protein LOC127239623 [Andrographis paniculata]
MATKSLLFQTTISDLKHLQWRSNANALCRLTFARPPLLPHHTSLLPRSPPPLYRRLHLPHSPPPLYRRLHLPHSPPPLLRHRLRTLFSTMSSMNSPQEEASVKTVRMVIRGRVQGASDLSELDD